MTGVLSADSLDAIAALRRDLFSEGYRPVTVVSHDGDPNRSPGKRPTGLGWQHRARRTPPEAAVLPATREARNTGILCDELRAIDVDIDDPATAGRVVALAAEMLGYTIRRTRDGTGRCLLLYGGYGRHAWEAGDRIRRWQDRGARTRLPVRGLRHALYRCAVIVARRFAVERAS